MFRCEKCWTIKDKSECLDDKVDSLRLICIECYYEIYCCQECGEDNETTHYNKKLNYVVCDDCLEEMKLSEEG